MRPVTFATRPECGLAVPRQFHCAADAPDNTRGGYYAPLRIGHIGPGRSELRAEGVLGSSGIAAHGSSIGLGPVTRLTVARSAPLCGSLMTLRQPLPRLGLAPF